MGAFRPSIAATFICRLNVHWNEMKRRNSGEEGFMLWINKNKRARAAKERPARRIAPVDALPARWAKRAIDGKITTRHTFLQAHVAARDCSLHLSRFIIVFSSPLFIAPYSMQVLVEKFRSAFIPPISEVITVLILHTDHRRFYSSANSASNIALVLKCFHLYEGVFFLNIV